MAAPRRYALLVYERQLGTYRAPGLIIGAACAALVFLSPAAPMLADAQPVLEVAWPLASLLGFALFAYAWIAPRFCYVQFRPTHLRLSTPLYGLAISYSRIRSVRPGKFTSERLTAYQRDLFRPLLGHTHVIVELTRYPLSERWLRRLLHPALFPHETVGFQFLTRDWMALSRDLDTRRDVWKTRRR